jgi:hypothetical protein
MKLVLVDDDGTVLDQTDDFSYEDFVFMQKSGLSARLTLEELHAPAPSEDAQ